jgi:hypothetical protein
MLIGLLTLGYSAFSEPAEDVVIHSADGARELYREGPYRRPSAQAVMKRVVEAVHDEGLESFLRARQMEQSRLGPVQVSNGRMGFREAYMIYARAFYGRWFRRRK